MLIHVLIEPFTGLLGTAVIIMYAFDRFNTPPSNRALTTAARYYISASVYILIYLISYSVLLYYPNLLVLLIKIANLNITVPETLPTTIVGAILLAIIIPKIPGFAKLDTKLRKFLQTLAAIPYEAYNLSVEISKAKFSIPTGMIKRIKKDFAERGFEEGDLIYTDTDTSEFLWVKITALFFQIDSWKKDQRFDAFFNERMDQFKRLEDQYKRLRAMALNCFNLLRQTAGDERDDPMIKAVNKLNCNFRDHAENLLKEICNFISQGVLRCQLTHGSRCRELACMGFQKSEKVPQSSYIIHNVVVLSIILTVLLLIYFIILVPDNWKGREKTLLMVTMIVSIYSLSVYCAVYLKEKYSSFRRNEDNQLPVANYLITGVVAVVLVVPVTLFFKTLIYLKGSSGVYMAMAKAFDSLASTSYPWLFMAFTTALITSFLSDCESPGKISETLWRLIQATVQAFVTACAAGLVIWWLGGIRDSSSMPEVLTVMSISSAVGFIIGCFIPHWYREERTKNIIKREKEYKEPGERLVSSEL
jgi:heme/copper-type cytochrome/quinol oxidase subunit 4